LATRRRNKTVKYSIRQRGWLGLVATVAIPAALAYAAALQAATVVTTAQPLHAGTTVPNLTMAVPRQTAPAATPQAAPSAPTKVSATDGTLKDRIRVTWNAASRASDYTIWRSSSSRSSDAALLNVSTTTTYDDTSATAGTVYYYWVKARNATGSSGFSTANSGYSAVMPAAPTGLAATDGTYADKVRLTWRAVAGAASYEIYGGTSGEQLSAKQLSVSTNTTYDDLSATPGTPYNYWVKARNAAGVSDFSNTDTGYRAAIIPPIPTGVAATDGTLSNRVRVTWNAATQATAYEVWRGIASSSATLRGEATTTTYDDTSALPGQIYYYWIMAKNSVGTSGRSLANTGYCPALPSLPTTVAATDGTFADKVRVTWRAATGATAYEVWRGASATMAEAAMIGAAPTTTYDDTTAIPGTVYYYWLKGKNAAGTSNFSDFNTGYRAVANLTAPTGVTATDGTYPDMVRVTWSATTEASAYEVWRGISSSSSQTIKIGEPATTNYNDTNITPGTTYYYWVKAKNAVRTSAFSVANPGYCSASIPACPTNVAATDGTYADKVRVTWIATAQATSFEVWRSSASSSSSATKIGNPTTTTYDDTSATPGTTYTYWVKAMNARGTSGFSSADTGCRPVAPAYPPTGVIATDGTYADKVRLTWNAVPGASAYKVWRGTEANTTGAFNLGMPTATTYDDTSADRGTIYYYWVQAYNAAGTSGFSSPNIGYR
jgi:fibronectin type 3 domain-containing protein